MRSKRRDHKKRGTASVELAVMTPFLLTLLFGIIEFSWAFTVRQAVVTAAREGAREAVLPGASEADIQGRIAPYMESAGVTDYSVEITRGTPQDPTEVIHVFLDYGQVSLVGNYFGDMFDFTMGATCSMRTEGLDTPDQE